jgi:hypothetical protein
VTSPFNNASFSLNVWTGLPYDVNSQNIYSGFGSASVFSNIYRAGFNTNDTSRPVWKITHTFSTPLVLPAGHYYLDWQTATNNNGAHFTPLMSTKAVRGSMVRNALQQLTNFDWQPITDAAGLTMCGAGQLFQELPFEIRGTVSGSHSPNCGQPTCYANCDGSTTVPFLNVLDFNCFLNRFSAGASYANCDNSTTPPVLNVLDFNCFLNKFSAGCSAP